MIDKASMKAITRHLVDRVGGLQAAAEICGVTKGEVSYWCNDNHDRFVPADHLMQLDAAAGDIFLKDMARARGYAVNKHEKPDTAVLCVTKTFGQFSKEAGELGFTVLDAAADNHLTPAERRRIRDDIAPVKDAIAQLERAIA